MTLSAGIAGKVSCLRFNNSTLTTPSGSGNSAAGCKSHGRGSGAFKLAAGAGRAAQSKLGPPSLGARYVAQVHLATGLRSGFDLDMTS